jgi:hypothetical protein
MSKADKVHALFEAVADMDELRVLISQNFNRVPWNIQLHKPWSQGMTFLRDGFTTAQQIPASLCSNTTLPPNNNTVLTRRRRHKKSHASRTQSQDAG